MKSYPSCLSADMIRSQINSLLQCHDDASPGEKGGTAEFLTVLPTTSSEHRKAEKQ